MIGTVTSAPASPAIASVAEDPAVALAEPSTSAPAMHSEPPLPNYDNLSVASLRARLRNLTVEQVRRLAEYEQAHAARPEVVTMFQRRIAKLEAEG